MRTRVASNNSPWLSGVKVGDIYTVPISHGEGRFIADQGLLEELAENGQIITQYVDLAGQPTNEIQFNPNGSDMAVEGLVSLTAECWARWVTRKEPATAFTRMCRENSI